MRFKRLSLTLGTAALIAGALGVVIKTAREGGQPKGSACLIVSAVCRTDVGERYETLTVAADPLDAGPGDGAEQRALEAAYKWKRTIEQATGCDIASYVQDLDGGLCAAQPYAVKRWEPKVLDRCRCCTVARVDGGCTSWTRMPCTLLAGRQDKATDHGCAKGEDCEAAP